jgi:hypothetical protein
VEVNQAEKALQALQAFLREPSMPKSKLYGKAFDEAKLIKPGRAYQKATDWHLRFPAL